MSEGLKKYKAVVYDDPVRASVSHCHSVYLAADVERVIAELISALRALHDVQNGSPLPKYDRDWKAAMEDTERLLAEWEKQP